VEEISTGGEPKPGGELNSKVASREKASREKKSPRKGTVCTGTKQEKDEACFGT
jgi:hypothetical protein